jgi:hypothetical protein
MAFEARLVFMQASVELFDLPSGQIQPLVVKADRDGREVEDRMIDTIDECA